jgi:hypothetical protein
VRNIILFIFPPYSTYILPPLNVGCFQPLKHYHAEAIREAVDIGDSEFKKEEFLAVLNSFRVKAFKTGIIKHVFRKVRIHPFNPDLVINTLAEQLTAKEREREAQLTRAQDTLQDEVIDL